MVVAESTADAFGRFKQLRPSVLISDIGMPGEDGYALIRRVRELSEGEGGSVPAIALTAYAGPEDARAAIAELAAGTPAANDPTPAALSARQRR